MPWCDGRGCDEYEGVEGGEVSLAVQTAAHILGTDEVVTVTAVSAADWAGRALAHLSDGRSVMLGYPIVGARYEVIRHPAKILHLEDRDGFTVERRGFAPVIMTRLELMQACGVEP